MDRNYEYNWNYYHWTINCLKEDKKYEELAFFMLGVDLMLRQQEVIKLDFDQFIPHTCDKYKPVDINVSTLDAVKRLYAMGKVKLFDKSPIYYTNSIRESNGDMYFNGHMMRGIGLAIHPWEVGGN